jgi:alginate O-acetyltransferase complex protein AlgJ
MINYRLINLSFSIALAIGLASSPVGAAERTQYEAKSFVGKDNWLFYQGEFVDANTEAGSKVSIDLIRRLNNVMKRNGISVVFTMPPIKSRLYASHLPDSHTVNPYMQVNYERMLKLLRAGGVNVADLNTPLLNNPKRESDTPLYFRLDTHWAPSGIMLAAEAVRSEIDRNTALKQVVASIPEERFDMVWSKRKVPSTSRDMIAILPEGSPVFAEEPMLPFFVKKQQAGGALLGESATAVALVGSSFSNSWEFFGGFPDALRFTLQREVVVSKSIMPGAWYGMEAYLRDDAFQTHKPKLIVWEMPERLMHVPPDSRNRDERYRFDNMEWLLRTAAWVQATCTPSPVNAKIVIGGLVTAATETISVGKTGDKDYIELSFSKPFDRLDYLVASVATGSKKLVLEASGAGVETRWIDFVVPGDGAEHVLKTPIPSLGKGFTKLKIFPGRGNSFIFNGLRVCRQPEDLLR